LRHWHRGRGPELTERPDNGRTERSDLLFTLDRQSTVPLAVQIEQQLRLLLERGQLAAGTRLPSIRRLAQQLGVSPNTVVVAYDRLVAEAALEARGKAGYFVSPWVHGGGDTAALLEAGDAQDPVWLAQQSNDQPPGLLLASSSALPMSWLQDAVPASVVQRALASLPGGMASRCPPQGMPALRERLALLMRGQGIPVDASRVLTVQGASQAIDLICRAFVQPGDAVVVENPGYHLLPLRLAQTGARVLPVTRGPEGVDLAQLEALFSEQRPRLFFMQNTLHNPTGWTAPAANLHRVLTLAERHGVLIAEDDVYGQLLPGQGTRLAQLASLGNVVYYASFCKVLSPALRMGYVAAEPALLRPLLRHKIHASLTCSALNEAILLELLAAGRVRKHFERLQGRLAAARSASLQQLGAAGITFDSPGEAGLFLWGRVPEGVDLEVLVKDAWQQGILLAGGATFSPLGPVSPCLRFNVVLSRHVRLVNYLQQRLAALAQGQGALQRLAKV
jgi:DNA-binding transcriptional MocR family regulator